MQLPPLIFLDLSLLFAIGAITVLILLEVASPYLGRINLALNRRKLKIVGWILGILFLITFAITTYNLLVG